MNVEDDTFQLKDIETTEHIDQSLENGYKYEIPETEASFGIFTIFVLFC